MKKSLIIVLFFFLGILGFLLASTLPQEQAKAGSSQNVSGWAWGETTGWISFNKTNCDLNPQCGPAGSDYGVNISPTTGVMSGYAWSENVGWISFNQSDLAGCPVGSCYAGFDSGANQFFGWAVYNA